MSRSLSMLAMLLLSTLLLPACADDDASLGLCDGRPCPDDCTALSDEGVCDVLDATCQARAFRAVGCVRGQEEGDIPPVRVLTVDEQRAEDERAEQRVTARRDADAEREGAGLQPPALPSDVMAHALGLFGMWQKRSASQRVDRLAGYYGGAQTGITLIDRGNPGDSMASQRSLAHELVHAYQDQQRDLFGGFSSFGGGADASLAFNCLVEGEARLYEMLAWGLLTGTAVDEAFMRESLQYDLDRARSIVANAGSPRHDVPSLCYGLGGSYLLDVWLAGGNSAVQARLDAPPVTSVQLMRAITARSDERWHSSGRRLACSETEPPPGFIPSTSDSLGALQLFALLSVTLTSDGEPPIAQSWERALDWQRDRFQTFVGPEAQIAASWNIRLSDEALAQELADELARAAPQLLVQQIGAEIELRAADSEELLETWSRFDACAR